MSIKLNEIQAEYVKCALDPVYYINNYGHAFDAEKNIITQIKCFPYQEDCLKNFNEYRNNIILKSRQCLPEDTLVDTPDGPIKIKHVKKGSDILSYNLSEGFNELDKVEDAWCSGIVQCVKIKLQDGRVIEVGEIHPLWVSNKKQWVMAKELEIGDEILDSRIDFGDSWCDDSLLEGELKEFHMHLDKSCLKKLILNIIESGKTRVKNGISKTTITGEDLFLGRLKFILKQFGYPVNVKNGKIKLTYKSTNEIFNGSHVNSRVISTRKSGKKKCYDLSIVKNQNFLVDGLVVHNTGLSVITAGYVAWKLVFRRDERILIIANDGAGAVRFLKTVKTFIENNPSWMNPEKKVWNTKKVEFDNGSWAEAKASSPEAGRGEALTLLVLDETAFIEHAETIWMAAGMALSATKGKCIMISCVPEDTFVFTKDGIKQVKDFINKDSVGGYEIEQYGVFGKDKIRHGTTMFNNGLQKTRVIKSVNAEIEGTLNHKLWACKNGVFDWHEMGSLSIGDYISVQYGMECWATELDRENACNYIDGIFDENKSAKLDSIKQIILVRMLLLNLGILSEIDGNSIKISDESKIRFDLKSEYSELKTILNKIVSIEESEKETYDFSLPHNEDDFWCHSVIYNGVLGHQTPKGTGGLYHQTWVASEKGESDFVGLKVHWTQNPSAAKGLEYKADEYGETKEWSPWYEEQCIRLHGDKVKIAQELDLSFEGSKSLAIEPELIKKFTDKAELAQPVAYIDYKFNDIRTFSVEEAMSLGSIKNIKTRFHIFRLPEKNKQYILASDVASGNGADYSTIQVIDVETLEQVAEWQGKVSPDLLACLIYYVGKIYNTAYVAVEANNHGLATCLDLQRKMKYERLYMSRSFQDIYISSTKETFHQDDMIPGFSTNKKTRPLIISNLIRYMREGHIKINSKRFMTECTTFIMKNDRAEHERGFNDDLIFALAIALYVRDTEYHNMLSSTQLSKSMLDGFLVSQKYGVNEEIVKDTGPQAGIFMAEKKDITDDDDDLTWLYRN